VTNEQRSDQPSTSADPVQDIDAAVQADRCVSIAQLELSFNLSQGTIWDTVRSLMSWLQRSLLQVGSSSSD
jgi:hypothetical protein